MTDSSDPIIKFYKLLPNIPTPQRADKSVGGTLPTRAYRYCEAIRTASSLGWYAFAPLNFSLVWDGTEIIWKFADDDSWHNLDAIQHPGFLDTFNSIVPPELTDCAPPLISALAEPGYVQVWSGLIAKTRKDWSILVRPPANLARSDKYDHFEGVIETDNWFGPLFINIRLRKTDVPIEFTYAQPLMQIQPLHRPTYQEKILQSMEIVSSIDELSDTDWQKYKRTIVDPGKAYDREKGYYAKLTRKRPKVKEP